MQYLKRNTKFSILAFLIIVLSVTISISTFAKTEVYFSLYDNSQKEIIKNINQAEAFINRAIYIFSDKEITIPLVKAQMENKVKSFRDLSNKEIANLHEIGSSTVCNVLSGRYKENDFIIKSRKM